MGLVTILRKLWIIFSVLFTSSFATIYLTNHYDYISKTVDFLAVIKDSFRSLSLRFHNWLFNDDLVSYNKIESEITKEWLDLNTILDGINLILVDINKTLEVMDSVAVRGALEILRERADKTSSLPNYSDLPTAPAVDIVNNPIIDWTYVTALGLTATTALTIGTAYLVWNGILDLSAIYSSVKRVVTQGVSALLSIFTYWSDDDDDLTPGGAGNSSNTSSGPLVDKGGQEAIGPEPTPIWSHFNKGRRIPPKIETDIPSSSLAEVKGGVVEVNIDPKKLEGFSTSTPWLYQVKNASPTVGPTADTNYDADSSSDDTITPSNKPKGPVVIGRILERLSPESLEIAKDYFRDETSDETRARIDRALNERIESKALGSSNDPVSVPIPPDPSTPTGPFIKVTPPTPSGPSHIQEVD